MIRTMLTNPHSVLTQCLIRFTRKNISDNEALELPDGLYHLEFTDGDTYVGDIKNGVHNGFGVFTTNNSLLRKDGFWVNGKQHNEDCTYVFNSGVQYSGRMQMNKFCEIDSRYYTIPENYNFYYKGYTTTLTCAPDEPVDESGRYMAIFPPESPIKNIVSFNFNFYTGSYHNGSKLIITFRDDSIFVGNPDFRGKWKDRWCNKTKSFMQWEHFQSYCWLLGTFRDFPSSFFKTILKYRLTIRQLQHCTSCMNSLDPIQQVQLKDIIDNFVFDSNKKYEK